MTIVLYINTQCMRQRSRARGDCYGLVLRPRLDRVTLFNNIYSLVRIPA